MSAANPVRWSLVRGQSDGRKVMRDMKLATNRRLYHMLSWEHAEQIFVRKQLRLSPVRSWKDPYERWWCDTLFERQGGLFGLNAYGLCWTTGARDEPRWRMSAYGKSGPIVRVRSHVATLLGLGYELVRQREGSMFLGAVRYSAEKHMLGLANAVTGGQHKEVTRTAASMLLHKRRAFRFESEVRLLWLERGPALDELWVDIDPASVINQVMISPYADAVEAKSIRHALRPWRTKVLTSRILRGPRGPA